MTGTIALLETLGIGLSRLVDAADAAGYRLCLLTGDRSRRTHELADLGERDLDIVEIDTSDIPACENVLRARTDLVGVITTGTRAGAELTARLGLPGPDPDALRTLHDRGAVRTLLHEAHLSSAPAVPASSAQELGFPVVLTDSGTSARAWLVRDEREHAQALREAGRAPLTGRLIAEPHFEGPRYSAETITWHGRTRLLGVTGWLLSPEPVRRAEAAAFPVAFPHTEIADLAEWITDVLETTGHDEGFAHTEFVLTVDGPEVVEITPSIGGTPVGEALCRALDTNVHAAMIAMAVGQEPCLLTEPLTTDRGIAFVLAYPSAPGAPTWWTGLDRLLDLPGRPEWYPTATAGDNLRLTDPHGHTGVLLAEGPTAELALHRALAAAGGIAPRTRHPE